MSGGRPKAWFGAQEVVVGAEDVLERRLIYLDLATGPLCSPLELNGHKGTHCRGAVGAIGSSVLRYLLYLWTDLSGREHWWAGKGILRYPYNLLILVSK
jgi:hypothetical protein